MEKVDYFSLNGKVAVVTGSSGLIGREIVSCLAEKGAGVVAADIEGGTVACDVTKEESVSDLLDYVNKKYGRLDIWVNSIYPKTQDWDARFEDVKLSSWKQNLDMHLGGYFISCRQAAEYMKKKNMDSRQKHSGMTNSGAIVNIASIYATCAPDFSLYEGTDMTLPAAYPAIKAGIVALSRYMASYYGRHGVRVNCVSPGGVENNQPPEFIERYNKKTLLGRMSQAKDVSGAVLYLASDASGYITGQNVVVDGGFSLG